MVSAVSTVPMAGTANLPDYTPGHAFVSFRQRCELQPEPWRQIPGPKPLNERKALQETREVAAAKKRPVRERPAEHARAVRQIESQVARFKQAYTEYDSVAMVSVAKSLRQPVHKLRVLVRADESEPVALPPRRSQMGNAQDNPADLALAWIHQIDLFLVGNDKKSGVPLDVWGRSFRVGGLNSVTRFSEMNQTLQQRREPHYKRLDRAESLLEEVRAELDQTPDTYTYARLDRTVRALRISLASVGHVDLPPHWLQYRFAGGFPNDNCRIWRSGLLTWLDEYDRVPTYQAFEDKPLPSYELPPPPAYVAEKKRVAQSWRRFLLIA